MGANLPAVKKKPPPLRSDSKHPIPIPGDCPPFTIGAKRPVTSLPLKKKKKKSVVVQLLDKYQKQWPEIIRKKRTVRLRLTSPPVAAVKLLSESLQGSPSGSVWFGKHQKGAREKFGTLSTHSLPEEVVEEILSRLPVKSLARFMCVSKSWNHLIYSDRFIFLHLNNYRTSHLLVGTSNVSQSICTMCFLPPPPPIGGYCDNVVALQTIAKREFPAILDGSCNGIVCLYSEFAVDGHIVFWNPSTKESKIIPESEVHPRPKKLYFSAVGFGFDPKTNDYKILQMVYDALNPLVVKLELYSLRKDSWRKVDCRHDFLVFRDFSPADVACRLPSTDNRIVCAVVSPLSGPRKWEILSFDMSSEMYEIIPVSPSLDAELGGHDFICQYKYRKLFPYKETIALGIVHRVGVGSFCDIWVLNNFDSKESRSWSKFVSTNVHHCNNLPVGCWGSQILFQELASGKLARFDHGNNVMVELGVFRPACVTTSVYKESLVRLNDRSYKGEQE